MASYADLHGFGTLLKEMRIIFQLRGVDVQAVRGRHYQAQGELLEQVRLSIQPHVEISGFQVGNKHENEYFSALSVL